MLAAVQQSGSALRYAVAELQADRSVVLNVISDGVSHTVRLRPFLFTKHHFRSKALTKFGIHCATVEKKALLRKTVEFRRHFSPRNGRLPLCSSNALIRNHLWQPEVVYPRPESIACRRLSCAIAHAHTIRVIRFGTVSYGVSTFFCSMHRPPSPRPH